MKKILTKKLLTVVTATIIAVTFIPTFAYATEDTVLDETSNSDMEREVNLVSNDATEIMESRIDKNEINGKIKKMKSGEYYVDGKDMDVLLPARSDDGISIETEAGVIVMELPNKTNYANGVLSDNGTVIYDPNNGDVAFGVQALAEEKDNEHWEALRVLVEIATADAGKEFVYKYTLPEGCKLIKAEAWYKSFILPNLGKDANRDDYYTPGEIYIIDSKGNVMETIDPAWAYDACGTSIPTYYKIRGTELVQIVDFNKKTVFPIVADPTNHPVKYTTVTLNESAVKKLRDKAKSTNALVSMIKTTAGGAVSITGYLAASFAERAAALLGGAGTAWAMIDISNAVYEYVQYSTWNKVYNKLHNNANYNYVKIKYRWKWHGGHKSYYPAGKETLGYYKNK
ncbi:MAG: hypothetical protein Q4A65_02855 [Bacillota bacterium]|nr:hypothetical protein [Bacillota bacterium]MDO4869223.1 hypothetical protein [Bacillota bacterium]